MNASLSQNKPNGGKTRRSRHFGPLKLWMAACVTAGGEEAEGSSASSAGGRAPAAQTRKFGQAGAAGAAAAAKPLHAPKLNLESAPHPTDAFMKGDGI